MEAQGDNSHRGRNRSRTLLQPKRREVTVMRMGLAGNEGGRRCFSLMMVTAREEKNDEASLCKKKNRGGRWIHAGEKGKFYSPVVLCFNNNAHFNYITNNCPKK